MDNTHTHTHEFACKFHPCMLFSKVGGRVTMHGMHACRTTTGHSWPDRTHIVQPWLPPASCQWQDATSPRMILATSMRAIIKEKEWLRDFKPGNGESSRSGSGSQEKGGWWWDDCTRLTDCTMQSMGIPLGKVQHGPLQKIWFPGLPMPLLPATLVNKCYGRNHSSFVIKYHGIAAVRSLHIIRRKLQRGSQDDSTSGSH